MIVHFENHLDTSDRHPLARDRARQRQRRHPADPEPGRAGRPFLYDFKVLAARRLLVPPAPPLLDQPGLQGPLRLDHRHRSERGGADGARACSRRAADTRTLALSDITVCKAPGTNDAATYDPSLPHVSGGGTAAGAAAHRSRRQLCDTPIDDHGAPIGAPLDAGDVPNIQQAAPAAVNEGQTVLTNGMNVGGRAATRAAPGALAGGAFDPRRPAGPGAPPADRQRRDDPVLPAPADRLTTGHSVPLVRIGGEGGLLDDAVLDGTVPAGFEFKYPTGEIVLDPGDRADVVAAIPRHRDRRGDAVDPGLPADRRRRRRLRLGRHPDRPRGALQRDRRGGRRRPTRSARVRLLRSATGDPAARSSPLRPADLLDPTHFAR